MWHFKHKFLSERFQIRWTVNIQSKSNATPLLQNEKSDTLVCFVQKQSRTMCRQCSVAIIFVKTSSLILILGALFVWCLQVAPPSLPSCSRFCRGSVSACPKLQPRPGRPSVRQQKQEREVAWKWTAHQGLVRRGVVGLHHKELRSASGSSNSIGTKLLQLVKHTEQIFWLNLWQDLVVKERQWDPRSLPLHHCLENQTHILFSWKDPPPEYPSCWEHTVTRQNPHPSRNFLCWKQVSSSCLVFYK